MLLICCLEHHTGIMIYISSDHLRGHCTVALVGADHLKSNELRLAER
jgi:hypothetical protein